MYNKKKEMFPPPPSSISTKKSNRMYSHPQSPNPRSSMEKIVQRTAEPMYSPLALILHSDSIKQTEKKEKQPKYNGEHIFIPGNGKKAIRSSSNSNSVAKTDKKKTNPKNTISVP